MKYTKLIGQPVPQSEPLDSRQIANNAGGFVYQLDDFARLERWLILGSDSNTYYQSAQKLTRENAACVQRCYNTDYERTISKIVEISDEGRAPKNDPAIFALALGTCHADVKVRQAAFQAVPKVCRIGTHLFQFVGCCRALGRGWGRAMKRAVAHWYDSRPVDALAYQVIKYRNREGYSHKRLLQTAHPQGPAESKKVDHQPKLTPKEYRPVKEALTDDERQRKSLYQWICGKVDSSMQEFLNLPSIVTAHVSAMENIDASGAKIENEKAIKVNRIRLVKEARLPWEALPTECNTDPDIWKAMLPDMGLTAMIRNLAGMTQYGALKPLSNEVQIVIQRLTDEDQLKKARIHPFNVLMAKAVYASGKSVKGSRTWDPIGLITDALETAFYKSFKFIEPSGKRTLIALDVSGSMSSPLLGEPSKSGRYSRYTPLPLSVCEGAAAMAMVTMRSENNWHTFGFSDTFKDLKLTASMSLNEVLEITNAMNFGGTDCALPMIYAMENRLPVDVFQVYTDNETWAGRIHPSEALRKYRKQTGINAKLVVVGMTSTGFSIADPSDPYMMDFVGFDSNTPALIADFARK